MYKLKIIGTNWYFKKNKMAQFVIKFLQHFSFQNQQKTFLPQMLKHESSCTSVIAQVSILMHTSKQLCNLYKHFLWNYGWGIWASLWAFVLVQWNRLFSLLAIFIRWGPYWGGDVPDVINLHPSPRFRSWFVDYRQ